ncbi:MAG: glutamine-hydrolyzing carbamoyl-phosphate synthase small subunit [Gammaproteobacteria bacterium]|nr:glutamine-hydrolyzing carbamoyl-phosphate synthase small subunit [Gammaproteobacteria bacterium]MCY4218738.1 glutamine-hydrolyzing carbamoyl-phosphate synthase small subunit [Gammaproteobacteria bacterium]MCY4274580.1 glutamine-hydrolyzing carbamoyl-phosphate synthase small subunit [Gammaproteobacteria bacterium]
MQSKAILALEDGTVFEGKSIGADGIRSGEVVFNTSMTGYQEILTDPSYARQLVALTYPHIGNVGTNREDRESEQIFCSGLIVRDCSRLISNWRSNSSLTDYLKAHNRQGISDIDTRRLTRILRTKGAQRGCILAGKNIDAQTALTEARDFPGLLGMDLAQYVSVSDAYDWKESVWDIEQGYLNPPASKFKVVAYDFGIKKNILRLLSSRGCQTRVVPAKTPAQDVFDLEPDGVFLSNGPGDPEPCSYAIKAIKDILKQGIPIFGICLGHQLLALASGAKTEKMKFGHHGANHPVLDIQTGKVLITSQNHGFTVTESSLNKHTIVTHRSLFDGTVQGIQRTDVPAFSFQGHPEASPGPRDIHGLFDRFVSLIQS